MYLTEGEGAAKASTIFTATEERFVADVMSWKNCVSLNVDNTNAMVGIRNSVASRFLGKNNEICIAGCPCHLAHIAAGHANDGFCNYINLNIEDVCVDGFYWLIKAQNVKTSWLSISNFEIRNINLFSDICPYAGFH